MPLYARKTAWRNCAREVDDVDAEYPGWTAEPAVEPRPCVQCSVAHAVEWLHDGHCPACIRSVEEHARELAEEAA